MRDDVRGNDSNNAHKRYGSVNLVFRSAMVERYNPLFLEIAEKAADRARDGLLSFSF